MATLGEVKNELGLLGSSPTSLEQPPGGDPSGRLPQSELVSSGIGCLRVWWSLLLWRFLSRGWMAIGWEYYDGCSCMAGLDGLSGLFQLYDPMTLCTGKQASHFNCILEINE